MKLSLEAEMWVVSKFEENPDFRILKHNVSHEHIAEGKEIYV